MQDTGYGLRRIPLLRLSEKVFGQRSEREFGRQAEREIGQKGTSWDPVGLLHGHLRDFSDSLSTHSGE
jgi:hypothetical protein